MLPTKSPSISRGLSDPRSATAQAQAGSLKPGEDPARAAARECQEEIGLIPSQLDPLGAFFPTPGYCDEEMNFYKASGLREPGPDDEKAEQDEDEDIETRVFSVEQLRSMIQSNEIIDLKTVAGLTLVGRVFDDWQH